MPKHVISGLFVLLLLLISFPLFAERNVELSSNLLSCSGNGIDCNYDCLLPEQYSFFSLCEQVGVCYSNCESLVSGTCIDKEKNLKPQITVDSTEVEEPTTLKESNRLSILRMEYKCRRYWRNISAWRHNRS